MCVATAADTCTQGQLDVRVSLQFIKVNVRSELRLGWRRQGFDSARRSVAAQGDSLRVDVLDAANAGTACHQAVNWLLLQA